MRGIMVRLKLSKIFKLKYICKSFLEDELETQDQTNSIIIDKSYNKILDIDYINNLTFSKEKRKYSFVFKDTNVIVNYVNKNYNWIIIDKNSNEIIDNDLEDLIANVFNKKEKKSKAA